MRRRERERERERGGGGEDSKRIKGFTESKKMCKGGEGRKEILVQLRVLQTAKKKCKGGKEEILEQFRVLQTAKKLQRKQRGGRRF
jgi:hypothetical protein